MIENTVPILPITDPTASLAFYVDMLGFRQEWTADVDGETMIGLARDGCAIMLSCGGQGAPGSWFWMGVEDESYLDAVTAAGADIVQAATNYPWAYELRIADPDGNVIRLGTGPK